MSWRVGLLGLLCLLPIQAQALQVVAMPLDAVGSTLFDAAKSASRAMIASMRELPEVTVVESQAISAELGINLVDQVQQCRRDTLCLVQIGEAVSADRLLLGELAEKSNGERILKLYVVDVTKAAMVDTITWTLPTAQGALEDALAAAMRQLFARPDARVIFEVLPKDAEISVYGERADFKLWEEIPFWSGVYLMRVERKGHDPREVRITLPRGGPTRVVLELEQDPLWFDPEAKKRTSGQTKPGKFAVVAVDAESSVVPKKSRGALGPSPFANWVAWSIVGVGGIASVSGGLVMTGAQADYNTLSAQPRFLDGTTASAGDASAAREDARSRFGLGSKLLIGGVGVAIGGLAWMLVDAALDKEVPESVTIAPMAEGGVTCAVAF